MDELEVEMKVVLYGRAGTGKTTLAGTFPGPILYLDFKEKGTDSIRDAKNVDVIRIDEFDEVEDIYWALKKGKALHKRTGKPYKTVVWDTCSQAQQMVTRELQENKKGREVSEGDVGKWGELTQKDWGKISSRMKEWITNYRDLDMNVVFIAHDRVFKGDNDGEEDGDARIEPTVGPALSPSVASHLDAAVSVIGNTFIREVVKELPGAKKGAPKNKKKRVAQYCLRIGPHAYYTTKIRKPKAIETPAVIVDPTYEEIIEYMDGLEDAA